MNDLSSFIEAQRAAGSFESAGSFTLALEKAVEKLSAHSLANPEDYILKLVQCAVRLRVNELHVKLLKRSVMVFFETAADDRTVSVSSLSLALAAPLEEKDPARAYLALALCAVAGQSPKELMWGEWDGSSGTILSLAQGRPEVFQNAPFPRVEPLAPERRFFLFYLAKTSEGLPIGLTAAEHCAVSRKCAFAPMPILLDGTPLAPSVPFSTPTADPVTELTSPYLGALEITQGEQSTLRWPPTPPSRPRPVPEGMSDFCSTLPPVYRLRIPQRFSNPMNHAALFSEAFGIPIHLYGSSNLHYVRDGVMLHPVRAHDAGGGAFAVLDGEHVKTDLSGLGVVRDAAVEADILRVTATWKAMIDNMLRGDLPLYYNKPIYARPSTLMSMFGCCLLGPFGLVAGPVHAFLSSTQSKRIKTERKLARQLEIRKGYLAYYRKTQERETL